jgi:hypothetical protein
MSLKQRGTTMNCRNFDGSRVIKRMIRGTLFGLVLLAIGCAGSSIKNANPEEDSFVIGRVKDRVIYKAGERVAFNYEYPEFSVDDFAILNTSTGKEKRIRMNVHGYFIIQMDPGDYNFLLKSSGTNYIPSARKRGDRVLKSCNVPNKSIVNIGTFKVTSNKIKGTIPDVIRFGVKPDNSPESFSDPLEWLKVKHPEVSEAYGDRIVSSD